MVSIFNQTQFLGIFDEQLLFVSMMLLIGFYEGSQ